ncbi:hypothetical protein GCM10023147_37740 [Tsukamurella soli]|uniref:Uncharacterized protein n=1 Tax=Tsukamurella soli TaxID=644556 RepID=A0ABP8K2U8_9ACTN
MGIRGGGSASGSTARAAGTGGIGALTTASKPGHTLCSSRHQAPVKRADPESSHRSRMEIAVRGNAMPATQSRIKSLSLRAGAAACANAPFILVDGCN